MRVFEVAGYLGLVDSDWQFHNELKVLVPQRITERKACTGAEARFESLQSITVSADGRTLCVSDGFVNGGCVWRIDRRHRIKTNTSSAAATATAAVAPAAPLTSVATDSHSIDPDWEYEVSPVLTVEGVIESLVFDPADNSTLWGLGNRHTGLQRIDLPSGMYSVLPAIRFCVSLFCHLIPNLASC